MTGKEQTSPETQLGGWLKSDVYLENVDFWQRAWSLVKVPHTQMPSLPYLASIPEGLRQSGARQVLDLGCGSGWLSIYLARQGFFVTGVDLCAHALELAKGWADKENLKIHFDVADLADLPYPEGSFDAIVANSIFEHLTLDLAARTISRLKNVLVPGGVLFACFDSVGGGPGEYYGLLDGTHVYTDKGRRGMLLRNFSDEEINRLFSDWTIKSMETIASGSRVIWAAS